MECDDPLEVHKFCSICLNALAIRLIEAKDPQVILRPSAQRLSICSM